MFSRRRAQSNPHQRPSTAPSSSAAATAAAQAFLANRASNASLSAAAAAVALRSHTTSPTPVSQVQTKRMIQRQASIESNGTAPGGRPDALRRQSSTGSMTERTFRDPSPARQPQSQPVDDEPPPLPPLPRHLVSPPTLPAKSVKRPASVEPPERLGSPPPKPPGGRGVSLDRGPGVMSRTPNRQSGPRHPSLGSVQEFEQSGGRGSINFSRPMSPSNSPGLAYHQSTASPTPSKMTSTQQSMAGRAALRAAGDENIQGTESNSIQKKKKKATTLTEDDYVPLGDPRSRPTGSLLQATPQRQAVSSSSSTPSPADTSSPVNRSESATTVGAQKKRTNINKIRSAQAEQSGRLSQQSYDSDTGSEQSYTSDRPRSFNTRAAGLLTKQPSIVREDREAEEQEERGRNATNGTLEASRYEPMFKPMAATATHAQPIGLPADRTIRKPPNTEASPSSLAPNNASDLTTNGSIKRSSLSPARAAHFSQTLDTSDGIKHQPPGRSLSPAKSALKHSPSSRTSSPAGPILPGWAQAGHAPSEASDTTSVVSDEGYRPGSRKKKNVRVSFDDDPTVVGRAATPPTSLDSPIVFSPQSKDNTKRGWFALGRDKKRDESVTENDDDGVIKPVPTLPSFGSVRGRKEVGGEGASAASKPSTESHSHEPVSLGSLATSNDFAVGGILTQDFENRAKEGAPTRSSNDPLPPEVTSVEGSGYHSDSEQSVFGDDAEAERRTEFAASQPSSGLDADVPTISVQPATPGISDTPREWLGVPTDSLASTATAVPETSTLDAKTDDEFLDQTPSSVGIAEPEPEAAAAYHDPASPIIGEVAHSLRHQTAISHDDATDDSGDSIYSDAAEDISDLEGDGFGSINAIVESPTVPTFPVLPPVSPIALASPVSPTLPASKPDEEAPEPKLEEGWDKAQAYWSGLSQSRKSEIEEAASPVVADQPRFEPAATPKKKKKIISEESTQRVQPQLAPLGTQTVKQKSNGGATRMKKSMRDAPPATSEPKHLRSSMRDTSSQKALPKQAGLQDSTWASAQLEPRGALQKKLRPVSAVPIVDYNKPAKGATHSRTVSDSTPSTSLTPAKAQSAKRVTSQPAKKAAAAAPTTRRRFSNGSDSDSSFKRTRGAAPDTGRYTMKRSMRATPTDERSKPDQSSRFSLRSLSPTGLTGRNQFNAAPSGMRTSMRGTADVANSQSAKSPTRSFGFGKSSKTRATPGKSASRFSSRFGDSSDEDDGPRVFRSRFVDSSDEDEPAMRSPKFAPVRGIPRRIEEGDSTDLEDSGEEKGLRGSKKPQLPQSPQSPPTTKLQGAALASGSLRRNGSGRDLSKSGDMGTGLRMKKDAENEKKKRSFFGSLGRKKDDSKVMKADVESAARRDTPLERSKVERQLSSQAVPQPAKHPKLQRRNTPKRYASDSWPLPQIPGVVDSRPITSDGVVGGRPGMGSRQPTAQTTDTNGVVVGRSGKKKRFPMLRKAFGLHD
ncbi:hypothetical protein MMC30_005293 [Trapelia coarctata]|nr:hypothetical protein [Trapelia coarctata]